MTPDFKIAIIGAGSVGFTKKLVTDILCVPEFAGHRDRADRHQRSTTSTWSSRSSSGSSRSTGCRRRVTATTDRREALEGARYVISCVRIGGLEAFADDIHIPLKYGVDQCVGDTICAGGIMYGQRTIPAILDFCKDIREVAEPGARFLNYANPMAMNTWAAHRLRRRRDRSASATACSTAGEQIAERARRRAARRARVRLRRHQPPDLVHRRAHPRPRDRQATSWSPPSRRIPVYSQQEKVRIDVLKRFGFYSTEIERPPLRIPALVPQAPGGDHPLDRHVRLDPRRDRRLPALLHREPQLVRDRLPALPRGGRQADRSASSAPTSTRATSSRRWRPAAPIAATSTSRTTASSPTCPTTRSSRSPGFVDRFGLNMVAGITLPVACAATCICLDQRPAHGGAGRR